MKKFTSWVLAAAAAAALLSAPAMAQTSPPAAAPAMKGDMKGMTMPKKAAKPAAAPMKMASAKPMKAKGMKLTCADYAWQSQDAADCAAGKKAPPNWR